MQSKPQQIPGWVKTWMGWPRWAQIVSLVGLMGLLTAGWLLAGGSTNNQPNSTDPFNDPTLLAASVFLRLVVVLLVMAAAFWILRRVQGNGWKGAQRQLQVLETTHLTPRRTIHLIQIGERKLLIGATDQSISLLTELDEEPAVALDPSTSFEDLLAGSTQSAIVPEGS
jgi:flagellar biosynthetic protein FliO